MAKISQYAEAKMSLFHYTDAAAVKSIIENHEIWLTDVRYLNDTEEFRGGAAFIQRSLAKINKLHEHDDRMLRAASYINDLDSEYFENELLQKPKFICSFSQKEDLLSQWRSYGSYAIEFDRGVLQNSMLGIDMDLVDCIYCDHQKEVDSENLVKKVLNDLALSGDAHAVPSPGLDVLAKDKLVDLCHIFKSKHFIEESEARARYSDSVWSEKINYRVRNGILVPYIPFSFFEGCIKSIHIGPMENQYLAAQAMKMFLEKYNSKYRGTFHIDVICSKIPYRTL